MPYIVELEQNLESARVRFCPDALAENIRIGSVGSMVWKGDLNQMRRYGSFIYLFLLEEMDVIEFNIEM